MLLLALLGCPAPKSPQLFEEALQPIPEPRAAQPFEEAPDACLGPVPYLPGEPPPFVTDGVVSCRASLVPEGMLYELHVDADDMIYWRDMARSQRLGRAVDRAHCTRVVGAEYDARVQCERDARMAKFVGGLLFTGGVLVGGAVAVGVYGTTR